MPEQAECKRGLANDTKNSAASLDDASHRQENHEAPGSDSNIRIPSQRPLLRMLESWDH